jgi:hypothetical protein
MLILEPPAFTDVNTMNDTQTIIDTNNNLLVSQLIQSYGEDYDKKLERATEAILKVVEKKED